MNTNRELSTRKRERPTTVPSTPTPCTAPAAAARRRGRRHVHRHLDARPPAARRPAAPPPAALQPRRRVRRAGRSAEARGELTRARCDRDDDELAAVDLVGRRHPFGRRREAPSTTPLYRCRGRRRGTGDRTPVAKNTRPPAVTSGPLRGKCDPVFAGISARAAPAPCRSARAT